MQQYNDLLQAIMTNGNPTGDRTGVGTTTLAGYHYACPMQMDEEGMVHNYPLVNTKKVFLRGTFEELLWKLRGETNIRSLVQKNVHIWSEWPFKNWLDKTGQAGTFTYYVDEKKSDWTDEWKEKLKGFEENILKDDAFANQWGDLGETYGHNFRKFGRVVHNGEVIRPGKDLLMMAIDKIRHKPEDRRNIITLWDPYANENSMLPPCPSYYQFFANNADGILHLNMYQRSCDTFLGVPFNTSQEALFLILMAKITGRKPGVLNHFFGDVHVYNNHIEQVKLQLSREPYPLPSIRINRETDNILDFEWKDVELINYQHHPAIKAPVAV